MNYLKVCKPPCVWRTTSSLTVMSTNAGSSSSSGDGAETKAGENLAEMPDEPTTCCMSGCANCVWLDYAEQLGKLFNDGGQKTKEIILSKVTDPSMKAFLAMELRHLENKAIKGS